MQPTTTTPNEIALRRTRFRQALLATVLVCATLTVALGWHGWRIYRAAQAVQQQVQLVQAAAAQPDARTSLPAELTTLHQRTRTLHNLVAPVAPLFVLGGLFPGVGADLAAAPPLIETAMHATAASDTAISVLLPLIETLPQQLDTATLQRHANELARNREQLEAAHRDIQQARQAWERVHVERLSPMLRTQVPLAQVDAALPALDAGIGLALAGETLATPLAPLLARYEQEGQLTPELVEQFAATRPQLERARSELDTALGAWGQLPIAALPPDQRQRVAQISPALYTLDAGLDLLLAANLAATPLAALIDAPDQALLLEGDQLRLLATRRAELDTAAAALERAALRWRQAPIAQLPPDVQTVLQPIVATLPLAVDALHLLPVLPDLLGANGERTYLLLLQNPDELRPTGGFISAAGTITVADGRIADVQVRDSTLWDDFTAGDYPPAPEPLQRYMQLYLLALRDANWSPDFPTSAATARDLFTLTQQRPLDGVIALTPTTVERIIGALGTLPLSDTLLTADMVQPYLREAWNPTEAINDEWNQRKTAALDQLAQALRARLDQGIERDQLLPLAQALQQSLDERHMLAVLDQPEAAALFAERQWNGAVVPDAQDVVLAVDANVGYNKVNAVMQQHLDYTVNLRDPAVPFGTLTLVYTNTNPPLPPDVQPCTVQVVFLAGNYRDMFAGCYWNYLRVLVPQDSTLLAAFTHPTPGAWLLDGTPDDGAVQVQAGAGNTTELATMLVVPQGERRRVSFTYRLPQRVVQPDGAVQHYRLVLQKQSGRAPIPASVRVVLPDGATLVSASHAVQQQGSQIIWQGDLRRDVVLDLRYRETP